MFVWIRRERFRFPPPEDFDSSPYCDTDPEVSRRGRGGVFDLPLWVGWFHALRESFPSPSGGLAQRRRGAKACSILPWGWVGSMP
jgi:hypothetical protein